MITFQCCHLLYIPLEPIHRARWTKVPKRTPCYTIKNHAHRRAVGMRTLCVIKTKARTGYTPSMHKEGVQVFTWRKIDLGTTSAVVHGLRGAVPLCDKNEGTYRYTPSMHKEGSQVFTWRKIDSGTTSTAVPATGGCCSRSRNDCCDGATSCSGVSASPRPRRSAA